MFMIEAMLNYSFGEEWKSLFDLVIAKSHKPKFFFPQFQAKFLNRAQLESKNFFKDKFLFMGSFNELDLELKRKLGDYQGIYLGDNSSDDFPVVNFPSWEFLYINNGLRSNQKGVFFEDAANDFFI